MRSPSQETSTKVAVSKSVNTIQKDIATAVNQNSNTTQIENGISLIKLNDSPTKQSSDGKYLAELEKYLLGPEPKNNEIPILAPPPQQLRPVTKCNDFSPPKNLQKVQNGESSFVQKYGFSLSKFSDTKYISNRDRYPKNVFGSTCRFFYPQFIILVSL